MATNVILPHMGLTLVEGQIVKWLKKEGEAVKKDEAIVEVLTEKVNNVVEAPEDGVILKIVAQEGDVVPVTGTLCWIGKAGEAVPATGAVAAPAAAPAEAASTSAPAVTPTAAAAPALAVHAPGEYIKASPIAKRLARENNVDLAMIAGTGPDGRVVEKDVLAYVKALGEAEEVISGVKASPVAKNLAKDMGVDLAKVKGTGPGGRVMKEDVLAAAAGTQAVPAVSAVSAAAVAPAAPVVLPPATIKSTIPLAGLRRIIAQRMYQSATTVPRVTHTTEADVTEVVKMREQIVASTEKALGFRVSYNDIIIKVVARALRDHPTFNARLAENEIQVLEDVNVAMAVSIPNGLVVPVIHNTDQKSLTEIAKETRDKADKARKGQLSQPDMSGGTFTVTNLGGFEIDAFTPIINLPEVAILGVGRIVEKPAIVNGEICKRSFMYLSLTFDHRVNDGAPAAEFLRTIKHYLEQPFTLLI